MTSLKAGAATRGWLFGLVAVVITVGMGSQFYRSAHSVIAPELMRDIGIPPSSLALLTGIYFIVGALCQVPSGMLFDRFGPRRSMTAMLVVAALGAAFFALAGDGVSLVAARALMGFGYGAVMMGNLLLCSRWFGPEKFPALVGLVIGVSQIGNLLATSPMAALSDAIGWRHAFFLTAAVTLLLALLFFAYVRDAPQDWPLRDRKPETAREVITGVTTILRDRRLWPIFLMAFCGYAAIITVLALWGSTYLHDVHGLDGVARGHVLLAMTLGLALGQSLFGFFARAVGGIKRATEIGIVMAILTASGLAATTGWPVEIAIALMVMHGFAGGFTTLIVAHGRVFYPEHLAGRGMTITNMCVLAGVGMVQIATGGLIALFPQTGAVSSPAAYGAVFAAVAAMLALAFVVYARRAPALPAGM